jgi:hypothetical protein
VLCLIQCGEILIIFQNLADGILQTVPGFFRIIVLVAKFEIISSRHNVSGRDFRSYCVKHNYFNI